MKTRKRAFVLASLALATAGSLYVPFPQKKLSPAPVVSLRLTDRNGILLREVLSDEGGRCRWVGLEEVSPFLVKATLAAEDRNFFLHKGIHLPSIARAFLQNLRRGRVVSGASTITQQVVRNIYRGPRSLSAKVKEAWLALRLEHTISKNEILVQYLNRISYGNQAYGVEAASRLYFDKPASALGAAESAFLAALPRSPSSGNPYRNDRAARERRLDILKKMADFGLISAEERETAEAIPLKIYPARERFRAPHFCDGILARLSPEERTGMSEIRSTLDYPLQEKLETLLASHLDSLEKKGVGNGAAVVWDNRNGEILAMAGSRDFFDDARDGQVNAVLALRQPGSTLKPFTYALALEKGMTAATVFEDAPSQFPTRDGYYAPQNYDRRFHGPTRLRSALACSYNVPAVSALEVIGPDILYKRLKSAGFESLGQPPSFYGMGLTLGNGEVSLLELVRAYAALACGGVLTRERVVIEFTDRNNDKSTPAAPSAPERIFSAQVAFIITHILADADARVPSFGYRSPLTLPFPAAAKTGTSKDFRDNWTIGFTRRYTVGVWVGNFDGRPMHNVSGITGCGPLYRDIMLLLHGRAGAEPFEEPAGITRKNICPESGDLAVALCPGRMEEVFISGTEPRSFCRVRHRQAEKHEISDVLAGKPDSRTSLEISFPKEGDIFKMDPVLRPEYQRIRLKALATGLAGVDHVEWWVNGRLAGISVSPFDLSWKLSPGSYTIKAVAVTPGGKTESRAVKVIVLG